MGWLLRRLRTGLRGRRGSAVLVAGLAAIVAVVAATTPILIRAVQQSALDHALASESTLERAVLGNASSNDQVTPRQAGARAETVTAALGPAPIWTAGRTYREQNDKPLRWTRPVLEGGQPLQRVADVPSCADLRFLVGHCPAGPGEAAIAQSTFTRGDLRLGDAVTMKSLTRAVAVRIVGVYDATTAAGQLQAHPSLMVSSPTTGLDPDVLLSPAAFTAAQLPTTAFSVRSLRTHVPMTAIPDVRADIARAKAVPYTAAGAAATTNAVTTLDVLLDRIDGQTDVVAVILQVVAAGAFALALVAFGAVAQRLGRIRAAEWALPRLRGMSRRRRLTARLAEPLLPLLGGALLGTAVAIGVALAVVDRATRDSVVAAIPAALGFASAATAGGVVAVLAVSAAADRRPLDEQLRRSTEPRELSRPALVGSAVVVVGAIAAVVALLAAPGTAINGAGLLAPILIALAVGLIGLQVALLLVRRRTRTLPSSLTDLIVWRRLSRAPSQAIASVLVAGAVALGTFVTTTAATADALADATAQAGTAAATVLHVRSPAELPLLTAVQRADPGAQHALAAEELQAGPGTSRVIAVDTTRLAAVSTWRSGWAGLDATTLARRLAPSVQPSLQLRGTRLTVAVDDIAPGPVSNGAEHFRLDVTLQTAHRLAVVHLGAFAPEGSRTFTAAVPCGQGCTVVSLSVRCLDAYAPPWTLHLRIASMATDVLPATGFAAVLQHGAWMSENGHVLNATLPTSSRARPGPTGLAVDLSDGIGSDQPAVRIRDTVEPLPAVLGATTTAERFPGTPGALLGSGVDASALLLRSVGRASALPRLLGDGALVDLRRMLPQIDRSSTRPDEQVWVRGDAGPIERRLRAEGVRIVGVETLPAAVRAERGEAGPLSARFALIGAVGALAVVLIALLGNRLLTAAGRRRQWGSFASGGVPLRVLRRLVALEFGAPAVAGTVVGALSGAGAFLLALPHLPLADAAPAAPPAGILPPWALGATFPVATLVAVLLMTVVVTRTETRGVDR